MIGKILRPGEQDKWRLIDEDENVLQTMVNDFFKGGFTEHEENI